MPLSYNGKLISAAKELRKNMTPQEKQLWYQYLCNYPIRFQRQKVIDRFIVDFYCSKVKLVVEVDGSQHYSDTGFDYDKERSLVLQGYGVHVIRFSNKDIDTNFQGVCNQIHDTVKRMIDSNLAE